MEHLRRKLRYCQRLQCAAGLMVLAGVLAGCGDDGIRSYSVPKELPKAAAVAPNAAWFLKITGPKDEVLRELVPFSALLRSFRYNAQGVIEYEVPPGWTRSPGPPPRHETLTIPNTDPPLEVTISSLPAPSADIQGYLRSNINRWRGQLGIESMPESGWMEKARDEGELVVIPTDTKVVAFVNLSGTTKEFGETRVLGGMIVPQTAGKEPVAPRKEPLTYTLPEGWKTAPGSSMRLASFGVTHETGDVDISVTRFPGGGDELANVNRWREQVKLEPVDKEALESSSEKLEVDGSPGLYAAANGAEQSIVAVIVPDGDAKWFFKMMGPTAAVEAETEHFREFVKSVKFNRE